MNTLYFSNPISYDSVMKSLNLAIAAILYSSSAVADIYVALPCSVDEYHPSPGGSLELVETAMSQQSNGKFVPDIRLYDWKPLPKPSSQYPPGSQWALFNDCVEAHGGEATIPSDAKGIFILMNRDVYSSSFAIKGNVSYLHGNGALRNWPTVWVRSTDLQDAATLTHEFGHLMGFHHTDNSDGDADKYDNPWDLMSDTYGHSLGDFPKSFAAHQKDTKGWLNEKMTITEEGEYIADLGIGGVELVEVELPNGNVIAIEPRRKTGWDAALPNEGVVVYEEYQVHLTRQSKLLDSGVPADYSNNDGSSLIVGETGIYAQGKVKVTVLEDDGTFITKVVFSDPVFSDGFE